MKQFKNIAAILIAFLVMTTLECYAQPITKGSLAFTSGQRNLNVIFNYDRLIILGVSEKDYLEMNSPKVAEEWEGAKANFKENFLFHLNKNVNAKRMRLIFGDYPDAPYEVTVNVLEISRNWEKITFVLDFTPNGNDILLARIPTEGRSMGIGGVRAGSYLYKTRSAFGYAGQNLGKYLAKKIK